MIDQLAEAERKKYELVWTYNGYRDQADGDPLVEMAFEVMGCRPGETLIDWGCGKGTPARQFMGKGLKVTGLDIAHNCLDVGVDVPLVVGCLWDPNLPASLVADYAFCTDVLEHIPERKVGAAIGVISSRTRKSAVIQVCCVPDSWGAKIDPPQQLHLTVWSALEWGFELRQYWTTVRQLPVGGKSRAAFYCAT